MNKNQETKLKECPYCGQAKIPFKMGVCICGKQVGRIQYVKNPRKFAKFYYSYKRDMKQLESNVDVLA